MGMFQINPESCGLFSFWISFKATWNLENGLDLRFFVDFICSSPCRLLFSNLLISYRGGSTKTASKPFPR